MKKPLKTALLFKLREPLTFDELFDLLKKEYPDEKQLTTALLTQHLMSSLNNGLIELIKEKGSLHFCLTQEGKIALRYAKALI